MSDEEKSTSTRSSGAPSFASLQLEPFRATGYELIPLNGKVPTGKGWRFQKPLSMDVAEQRLDRSLGNVGVRLRLTDLVLDFDPRHYGGEDQVERMARELGIDFLAFPHVVTGSGGHHYYMTVPDDLDLAGKVQGYPGVDVKKFGGFVVAPGSSHPETGGLYEVDPLGDHFNAVPPAPEAILKLVTRPPASQAAEEGCISPQQLEDLLDGVDPAQFSDYDDWLRFAMACHQATRGLGSEEFLEWSAEDPTYAGMEALNRRKWNGFQSGGGITAGTLAKLLREKGYEAKASLLSAWIDFSDVEDLEAAAPQADAQASDGGRGGLAEQFVWVARPKAFFECRTGGKLDPTQFTSLYQQAWPDGNIVSAVFRGRLPIRKFEHLVYEPGRPEFIDGKSGGAGSRYNIWRRTGCEPSGGEWPTIRSHVEYLWPDDPVQQNHFYDYLSFLVREDFVKVHFALLLKGPQGIGKSFFGKLARHMLGSRNVVLPSNDEVNSRWTAWTEGAQLAVIEELMTRGRVDMANRLKPIITQEDLRIEDKGFPLYTIPNRLNLIAFTNHSDALPIEKTDRRWMVLFSDPAPFESDQQQRAYYAKLFAAVEAEGSAFKQFLQTRKVALDPKGHAPMTKGKEEMRRLSLGDVEQTLEEMLGSRDAPFDFDLVRVEDLLGCMPKAPNVQKRVIKWLKEEAGAREHTRYTKSDGSGRKSWTLWSIRDHDKWLEAGPAGRIDAYLEHTKII